MNARTNFIVLGLALVTLAAYLPVAAVRLHDLGAFYCAGQAVRLGADPYREHPLHDCERHQRWDGVVSPTIDYVTVPAPLQGYALAAFASLSFLPFPVAAATWVAISFSASASYQKISVKPRP